MNVMHAVRALALMLWLVPLHTLAAGTLIVSGDDWVITSSGPDPARLGRNIADQFDGTDFLLVDDNPYLPFSSYRDLIDTLESRGNVELSLTFDAAALDRADSVFLFGTPGGYGVEVRDALEAYLFGGGNVFIQLGTGLYGDGAAEADYWNVMLGKFGLYAERSFGPGGWNWPRIDPTSSPLAAGVDNVLWANGNYLSALPGREADVSIVLAEFSEISRSAGVMGMSAAGVPEPASVLLLAVGVAAITLHVRRRRPVG